MNDCYKIETMIKNLFVLRKQYYTQVGITTHIPKKNKNEKNFLSNCKKVVFDKLFPTANVHVSRLQN